jgi:hypothetical protein
MHPFCAWLEGFHMGATVPDSQADRHVMGYCANFADTLSHHDTIHSSSSFVYHGGHVGLRFHMLCRSHSLQVALRNSEDALLKQQRIRNSLLPEVTPEPLPPEVYQQWHKPRYVPSSKKKHQDKHDDAKDTGAQPTEGRRHRDDSHRGRGRPAKIVPVDSNETTSASANVSLKKLTLLQKKALKKFTAENEPSSSQSKPRIKIKGFVPKGFISQDIEQQPNGGDVDTAMMDTSEVVVPNSGPKKSDKGLDEETEPEGGDPVFTALSTGGRKRKLTFKFSAKLNTSKSSGMPLFGPQSGPKSSPIPSVFDPASSGHDTSSVTLPPPSKKKKKEKKEYNELVLRIKAYPAPLDSKATSYKGMTYELVIDPVE